MLEPERVQSALEELQSKDKQSDDIKRRTSALPDHSQQEPGPKIKSKPKIFLDLSSDPEEEFHEEKNPVPAASPDASSGRVAILRKAPNPRNSTGVVVFDLETQKLADEVGGWRNISKMRVSIAVTYSEGAGFVAFKEENVADLVDLLKSAELVVGFNQMRFDYEVLRPYTRENLRSLPNLDILQSVESALGFRLPLNHLAEITLGRNKSGHGTDAAAWFREGRMDLIEQYCRDDVCLTRDLYRFGLENGLKYKRKDRRIAEVLVNWRSGPSK